MRDNSLQRNGSGIRQGAAEISPADYPLSSPESRAAARALVSQRTALSPADRDALNLYNARYWLSTQELRPLEATAVYQRGNELHLRLFGSTGDEYEGDDPLCQRRDRTLRAFEFVFHRDPKPGDILRASELIECWHGRVLATFEELITAWQRSLPGLPCPLRIEDRRILFRRTAAFTGQPSEWSEAFVSKAAHVWWSLVEEEATGEANRYPEGPTIAAVQCLGADRWKALRAEGEVEAPRP
jgi:hypothetical protein